MRGNFHVAQAIKRAGLWALVLVCAGLIGVGLGKLATGDPSAKLTGRTCLVVVALIAVATMRHWLRALPGFLGVAAVNSAVMSITGHGLSDPALAVSRVALGMASVLLFVLAVLCVFLSRRQLRGPERLSICILIILLFVAFTIQGAGLLCLLVGNVVVGFVIWVYRGSGKARRHIQECHRA